MNAILNRIKNYFNTSSPPVKDTLEENLKKGEEIILELQEKGISLEEKKKNINFIPTDFDEYIGQEKVKSILNTYIENSIQRETVLPHILINGKPGTGKTTLARIIADMMDKDLVEIISSSIPKKENKLQKIILGLNGAILFIDEIHAIPREEVETIYSMMEDFSLNGNEIEPFTLIGATTELGGIIKDKKPFYDRFALHLELEDYSLKELKTIIKQYKDNVFSDDNIDRKHYIKVAENSRYTPRIAINLTKSLVYFKDDFNKLLDTFNIIYKGYTEKDYKLLNYLNKNKIVGLQGVASFLDTSKENYLYEMETYLIKTGVIVRSPRGRQISEEGRKLLKQLEREMK